MFFVTVGYFPCVGNNSYGIGGGGTYASYGSTARTYRVTPTVSGDDLIWTIDDNNKGGSNGTSQEAITNIWGIF